jgi:hypothetical protein
MNGIHEVRGSIPLGSTNSYFSAVSNFAPGNVVSDPLEPGFTFLLLSVSLIRKRLKSSYKAVFASRKIDPPETRK